MKKLTLLFLVGITLFSCKKNDSFQNELQNEGALKFESAALNEVVLAKSTQEQKQMYLALSAKEKLEIWIKKLQELLSSGKLNPEQKIFIENLLAMLTEELFEPGSEAQAAFNSETIKQQGIELFGFDVAFAILGTLDPNEKKLQIFSGASAEDCGCSTESDWCSGDSKCSYLSCDGSLAGCGTLWLSSCNGLCQFPVVAKQSN